MRVVAVRENPANGTSGADAVVGAGQLDEVLPQADYVLLCTPVTPATTGMMNQSRLAKMKSDAYLLNVGRGPLIDDAALIEALMRDRKALQAGTSHYLGQNFAKAYGVQYLGRDGEQHFAEATSWMQNCAGWGSTRTSISWTGM